MAQKRNITKTNTKKKAMLEALEKTLGVVTSACKISKISRTQHYKWLKDDENYAKEVKDVENIAIDFAESKLHGRISDNDTASIIFFLKTKGRSRGYNENLDVTSKGDKINQVTVFELPDNGRNKDK